MDRSRLESFLPDLALASRVALRLQHEGPLELPVKGEFDNPMGQALTIADPVLQAFLEARLPEIRLELEEEPYRFRDAVPEGPEGTLWVDPIDGTRYYADNLPTFGISMAWTRAGLVNSAIYVVPAEHRAFLAGRGEGAVEVGLPGTPRADHREPVVLDRGRHVIWSRVPPDIRSALIDRGFVVVDPSRAYDPTLRIAAWQVLSGPVAGIVWSRGVHVRDGGVIAHVAQEAGGVAQTLAGKPWDGTCGDDGRTEGLVIAVDPDLAAELRALHPSAR